MPYVITQTCCNDGICSQVCPTDAIHPRPDEPAFRSTEMLYIDPDRCVECEACVEVCPVSAIHRHDTLPDGQRRYAEFNAAYYRTRHAANR